MVIKLLLPIEKSTTRLFKTAPDSAHSEQLAISDDIDWRTPNRLQDTFIVDNIDSVDIVFNLETTGFSRERHHVIKLACEILD